MILISCTIRLMILLHEPFNFFLCIFVVQSTLFGLEVSFNFIFIWIWIKVVCFTTWGIQGSITSPTLYYFRFYLVAILRDVHVVKLIGSFLLLSLLELPYEDICNNIRKIETGSCNDTSYEVPTTSSKFKILSIRSY